jgi:site-specific DNA recombinase
VLGDGSFGRGALYHLLRNRIYLGEVVHKGAVYPGEHEAIVDEELWNAVQDKLNGNVVRQRQSRIESGALLGGLIFDDRGNRMSPTHTMRRSNRYRYYISQTILRGCWEEAGSLPRIGADDMEGLVVEGPCAPIVPRSIFPSSRHLDFGDPRVGPRLGRAGRRPRQ